MQQLLLFDKCTRAISDVHCGGGIASGIAICHCHHGESEIDGGLMVGGPGSSGPITCAASTTMYYLHLQITPTTRARRGGCVRGGYHDSEAHHGENISSRH